MINRKSDCVNENNFIFEKRQKHLIFEYRLPEKLESYHIFKRSLARNYKIEKRGSKHPTKIYLCLTSYFYNRLQQ